MVKVWPGVDRVPAGEWKPGPRDQVALVKEAGKGFQEEAWSVQGPDWDRASVLGTEKQDVCPGGAELVRCSW